MGGERAVGPVPDEHHVVLAEPELALRIPGERLVRGPAKGSGDCAGHDGDAAVVYEPLPGCRVQSDLMSTGGRCRHRPLCFE